MEEGFTASLDWRHAPAALPEGALPVNEAWRFAGNDAPERFPATRTGDLVKITGITGFSDWYAGHTSAVPVRLSELSID